MTILKAEKILIFQQVCCYGNSCKLPFVTKHCARAAPAWVWGTSNTHTQQALCPAADLVGGERSREEVSVPQELVQVTLVSSQVSLFISPKKQIVVYEKMGNKIHHLY